MEDRATTANEQSGGGLSATTPEATLEARSAALLQGGEPLVLVTVVASAGSAPRHAGTRALQTRGGFEGTVGGGAMEAAAMKAARQCLNDQHSAREVFVMDATAAMDSDMICGGRMEVLCEALQPGQAGLFALADASIRQGRRGAWLVRLAGKGRLVPERRLYVEKLPRAAASSELVIEGLDEVASFLNTTKQRPGLVATESGTEYYVEPLEAPPLLLLCGGGHVALEVARLAHACGFVVDVVDDREEFANRGRFPMARHCHVLPGFSGLEAACGLEPRHYVAIMTRGHAFDREVLEQALRVHPRYLGMIGSRSKREHVYRLLRAEGVPAGELARVCCPIGLGIYAETPQQIAVSVVAELLAALAGTLPQLRGELQPADR